MTWLCSEREKSQLMRDEVSGTDYDTVVCMVSFFFFFFALGKSYLKFFILDDNY